MLNRSNTVRRVDFDWSTRFFILGCVDIEISSQPSSKLNKYKEKS